MSEALKPGPDESGAFSPRPDETAPHAGPGNIYALSSRPPATRTDAQSRLFDCFNGDINQAAIDGLASTRPEESAKRLLTHKQLTLSVILFLAFAAAAWCWPLAAFIGFNIFVTLYFISAVFFRLCLLVISRNIPVETTALFRLADVQLPTVTILLPLYRDSAALPALAQAIDGLNYPARKKDVKLLLEEDDPETIAEVRRLALDQRYETVIVPPRGPRTKPKACNYGLYLARGELIVIYDAEDLPEPDQLRKAAERFAEGDAELACVQARLNYYNREDNWLTRGIMAQTPLEFTSA